MKNKNILVCAVLAVINAGSASACDICAAYSAQEAQGGKGFYSGLAEQFTWFGTIQSFGHEVANKNDAYIASSISQIFAGYNFNNRVGVQFNLPVIYRDYGTSTAHGSEIGVGDVLLLGNLRIYEKDTDNFMFNWTALGGIKFPTGDTAKLNAPEFAEGIGGHDLTLGSGSFDGIVGTGFAARWKRIFLNGNMQYAIRTEGDYGYQFANDWTWAGGPGLYAVMNDDCTLAFQAVVSGESKGMDTTSDGADPDTAETIVYLGPQITFTWHDRLSAFVGVDVPVSVDTPVVSDEPQLVPDYRIRAAVTWRF